MVDTKSVDLNEFKSLSPFDSSDFHVPNVSCFECGTIETKNHFVHYAFHLPSQHWLRELGMKIKNNPDEISRISNEAPLEYLTERFKELREGAFCLFPLLAHMPELGDNPLKEVPMDNKLQTSFVS